VKRLVLLLSVHALLLSACTFAQGPGESLDDDPAFPSPTAKAGQSSAGEPPSSEGGRVLTGTLGFDAIEGGCAYLETADGKRYEVIYPAGWQIDRATGELVGPDGRRVKPGDHVSVRGSVVADMSSICQIGPIFRASAVFSAGD
jgi:hypothetical protein